MAVFQARARTVDMLGHQQVTDIATAISELFKNAHDAYAQNVDIDYLRDSDLIVVRDNGFGMSRQEFETRWLTLAADSAAARSDAPAPPKGMEKRPIQGEKGIGRLAIATIGPQALVLTRPKAGKLTMALINWRLFEAAGVNLGEVEIPLSVSAAKAGPSKGALRKMANELAASLDQLDVETDLDEAIREDLELLDFDPSKLLRALGEKSVVAGGHGTVFIITPTRPELLDDLEEIEVEADPPPGLLKTLIGFSNTMVPGAEKPRIEPSFRDHRGADDVEDIIGSREFFTPKEFKKADHSFAGSFDRYGRFEGMVSVYGAKGAEYDWTWPGAKGRELNCGAFKLSLAYVQGNSQESRLDRKGFDELSAKLARFGGIYVYRDGIRVLPYGDPEFDFLKFEEQRTRQAGRAFFSYRRMFGAIELDGVENSRLREKAGREGFRNDRAYRDFVDLLREFFAKVAADFFVKGGDRAAEFELGKEEQRRRHAARLRREAETLAMRQGFEKQLASAFEGIETDAPAKQTSALLTGLGRRLTAIGQEEDPDEGLNVCEKRAFGELEVLRRHYAVRLPADFGLSPKLRREWEALSIAARSLEDDYWIPTAQKITELVAEARKGLGFGPDRRRRLIEVISSAAERNSTEAETAGKEARESLQEFEADVSQAIGRLLGEVVTAAAQATEAAKNGKNLGTDRDLDTRRGEIEVELNSATGSRIDRLGSIHEQLTQGLVGLGLEEGSSGSLTSLLEEEVLELRDRVDQDLELAQLGMATQVISHELSATVLAVRAGLRRLGVWAEANENMRPLYEDLRGSFDHLDGYLNLFTPLQRRLRRRREALRGKHIDKFLRELFARRFDQDEIDLRVTETFDSWQGSGYRSTLYPALVNLVDNAIFWVGESGEAPRWIELDADGKDLLVSDSGPGVPARDRDAIWEFGFTRKPRGRGAGLHIAREALQNDGWTIALEKSRKGRGATFRIAPEE